MGAHDIIPRKFRPRGGNQAVITLEPPWSLGLDDTQFFLYDNLDETKRARFQLAGLDPNTEVVYDLPSQGGPLLVANVSTQRDGLVFILNGMGASLATGVAGDLPVPYDCTIIGVRALADQVGSLVVDIWANYGSYPPTNSDSITGASPVTIAFNDHGENYGLGDWTTFLNAESTLRYNVDSCSGITRCTIGLVVLRTIGV